MLSAKEKVGQGVEKALEAESKVYVVIALEEPQAMKSKQMDLDQLRSQVSGLQKQVLSNLDPSNFILNHQFKNVPGLTGWVTKAGLSKLEADPNVRRVDIDMDGTGHLADSAPLVNADQMAIKGITGEGVVVAVIDSGLDTDHDDLSDDLIFQVCFGENDGSIDGIGFCPNGSDRQSGTGAAEDNQSHGTHVTGIITSKGTISSTGVAPNADIVSIKVLDNSSAFSFFSEVVAALDFIIASRPDVKIINMSLGTSATYTGDCDNAHATNILAAAAISTLRTNGVIAFASSGNGGSSTEMSAPACLSDVVAVGATTKADAVWSSTNSNSSLDILAPGVSILSTGLSNGTVTKSGTSMASPHASGCAALLVEEGVDTTPDQIEARLKSSSVQLTDSKNSLTFPRIDCSPTSVIPTVSEWAMLILSVLIGGCGIYYLRRLHAV